ncbi:MAG TPA: sulfite exporter TauE/SafE family protein [Alphaproteobacteria bacterium]
MSTVTGDLLLSLATFVAAFASGLAGFAFALIATGIYLYVLAPAEAVPLVLAGSLTAQTITLLALKGSIDWLRLHPFLIGGIVGIPLGAFLLQHIDVPVFRLAVGAFLVAYSVFMFLRPVAAAIDAGGRAVDGAIGFIGGVMGGLAGLSGAIPTIWCGLRGWPKQIQRGVYQPYIFVMQLLALVWLGGFGTIGMRTVAQFLICLPALVIGTWLGLKLYARVDDAQFRRIVLLLLLGSGIGLLV